jgi:4,5-DOPA dioxygenase extradiol
MPALFVGHGNPMNAIEDNEYHRAWRDLGRTLPRPRAILCISAHWETGEVMVTAADRPETIHDFHGFPRALFEVEYPAPGEPRLARRVVDLIGSAAARPGGAAGRARMGDLRVGLDTRRGLDHGAWSVLIAMYPRADIPVVQLSLASRRPPAFHYALGRALEPLRDEGVLVIGSGNIVHNLALWDHRATEPVDWAARCDAAIRRRILARDHDALIAWPDLDPDMPKAAPTPEHYLPLLYTLALHPEGEPIALFNGRVTSTISMTSVRVGGDE